MSEEIKNNVPEEAKKPFSVNIPEDDFVNDIPAPESDVPASEKPHKVVRYVDNAPKEEKPAKTEKKKSGFVGEFLAGAAAGAKTVGEGIAAGAKTVSEKKPKAEKKAKPAASDETQFPKEDKKPKAAATGGIMDKIKALPTGAVIGGAAVLLVVLVALILILATSCSSSANEPNLPEADPGIVINPSSGEGSEEAPEDAKELEVPDRKTQFADAFSANNDVVGWLYIPGLEDIDAGVCFSYDKSYPYNKRDVTGKKVPNSYWIDGAYYTHFRGLFGDTALELSPNTVIFGHSDLGKENLSYKDDDPNGPLFSQLFNFKDPSFAEKTPYIYLTLPGEDSVWEVFAVFYNDAKAVNSTFASYYKNNAGDLWYIEPNPSGAEYALMIQTMRERSLYDYDVEVGVGDQILTLSTCTVGYGINNRDNYRFVVVAKLVKDSSNLVEKNASFTINADAPIPSTYEKAFQDYEKNWKPAA